MTTERAIELLHRLQDEQFDGIHGDERREALSMAVRALESNLVKGSDGLVKDLVKDCISRQQAIDALDKHIDTFDAIDTNYLCGLRTAMSILKEMPSAQPHWIPCSERLPEEDHWLGGSGRQFSDEVLVSVANYDDEDIWTYISQTIDGEWALELPSYCKIIAWMPLPEPYGGESDV